MAGVGIVGGRTVRGSRPGLPGRSAAGGTLPGGRPRHNFARTPRRPAGPFLRLRIAPLSRGAILGAKALACFAAIVVVSTVFLGPGRFAFGVRTGSPGLLALALAAVAFGFVGVMMLLATAGRSEQAVSSASWAVLLVMAMLGGGMVPLVALPDWMRPVGHASPVKWGILALEGAIWRGFDLREMMVPVAVLAGIGLVALSAGLAVLSRREYASG